MNLLETIDLEPLRSCKHLFSLDLARNHLSTINLSPLAKCGKLEELYLYSEHKEEQNDFKTIDLTPLFSCRSLEDVTVAETTELTAKKKLRRSAKIPEGIEDLISDERITWV